MKKARTRKRSVGSRIIERLEGFKNALKSGQKISESLYVPQSRAGS